MSLLAHAYQLQNSNVHTLMVALRQLNTVEEAEEDIHEVKLLLCSEESSEMVCVDL